MLAANRIAQRIPGKADHAVGAGQPVDPRIHRAARLEIENARGLKLVLADQSFDRVQDPRNVVHAADDFGTGKQFGQQRQPRTPVMVPEKLAG